MPGVVRNVLFVVGLLALPLGDAIDRAHGQTATPVAFAGAGVIPDTVGTIAEVLLHYDPDLSPELEPVLSDFFGALPRDVQVTVICPSEWAAQEFIEVWDTELGGRDARIVNMGLPVSIWARDRYISRQTAGLSGRTEGFVPISYQTYEPEKCNELLALELLGEASFMPSVLDSSLYLEGGNVVSNGRHVFVGANVLPDNENIPEKELAEELRMVLGRETIVVGDAKGEVPWCHIDMYLTPISDDTVLVANPRMAELILASYNEDDQDAELCGGKELGACPADSYQQRFDDVAALMQRRGYRVLRVPALVEAPDEWMVTYNNVIMDHRDQRNIVYMPTYDIPELDRAAAAIYLGLGFEVRTIDVSKVYASGGAIRCLVNVTERRRVGVIAKKETRHRAVRFFDLARSHLYERMLHRSGERLAHRGRRHLARTNTLH
jgi:N-dimethylarginine dimethylaminohydrolase